MYGIAYKATAHGSWKLEERTYNNRKNAEIRAHYVSAAYDKSRVVYLGDLD
jgi:hypothetical protein